MKDYIGFKSSTYSMFRCFSPKHPNLSLEPYQSVMAGKIHQAVCIPYEMMRKKPRVCQRCCHAVGVPMSEDVE